MNPFYHPTSVLVLDDDPLFLESLDFQFGDELTCQTFTRPDAALEHLRSQEAQHPNFARYFSACSEVDRSGARPHGDQLLRLQVSELRSMLDDQNRHQRVSVAVVDYDMPKMTGVQFCRAIRDLPVKTILLTGKAGLETAINAFNERAIDCFLQKQDPNVSIALRSEIKRLQGDYFNRISCGVQAALSLQANSFIADPNFVDVFQEIARNNHITEYCICASPPGVMMVDADGNELFLLVADQESAAAQLRAAEKQNAPSELAEMLRSRKALAWFPTAGGSYHPDFQADWAHYVWPAEEVSASKAWSYSLIRRQGPMDPLFQSTAESKAAPHSASLS
jgi:CheY-like chemotaxis protein